jgi:ribosomal protein S27AE
MNKTKVCKVCGEELALTFFDMSKNRLGKKYHRGICRFCYNQKYQGKNNKGIEERKVSNIDKFRTAEREGGRRWRQSHRQEHYVHTLLNRAIKSGIVTKQIKCSKCGIGGVKINAHHEDYSKPYDVIWLCDKCHAERHKQIRKQKAVEFWIDKEVKSD